MEAMGSDVDKGKAQILAVEKVRRGLYGMDVCQATATAAEYTVFFPVVQVTVATFMLLPGRQGRKERFVFRSPDGMKGQPATAGIISPLPQLPTRRR